MRLFFMIFMSFSASVHAQSVLEKRFDIVCENGLKENIIRQVETTIQVTFSYNADIFGDTRFSGEFKQIALHDFLDTLLGEHYAYRVKGNYIIIKSTREIIASNEKQVYTISGYIKDRETGEIISFATIYDSASLKSTLSNEQGYFELNLEQKPEAQNQLGVSREAYLDTYILIKPIEKRTLEIALKKAELTQPQDTGKSNLDKDPVMEFLTNTRQRIQSINLKKNFKRKGQISFVPYLGTNGSLSGSITNNWSLNIIGGYSGGIKGAEFGGVFNIDRDTSRGAQFAGVYNLTAGPFSGGQFSGVLNNHFSAFTGIQAAGVANTCSGVFSGTQLGGVVNFARTRLNGIQAAGVINYAKMVNGIQTAGVINTAEEVRGIQAAGIVNTARVVRGSQVGFINIADTVKGLQIGFLSFCKTGVHQVEYSYNDVLQHNISLRTGSTYFYNILTAGYHPYSNEAFAAGYGIGSKLKLGKVSAVNFELSGTALYLGLWQDIHSLYRFSIHHELVLFKSISLIAGPDFNFYYSNGLGAPLPGYKSPISFIPPVRNISFNQGRTGQVWVGFHVGIGLN